MLRINKIRSRHCQPLRLVGGLLMLLLSFLATSCQYRYDNDSWAVSGKSEIDSVDFRATHHYWRGYNFAVVDTFSLASRPPFAPQLIYSSDSVTPVAVGDIIAVEDVVVDTTGTASEVWIKLAAARQSLIQSRGYAISTTSGWTSEREMLEHVVPNEPISRAIHFISSPTLKLVLGLSAVGFIAAFLVVTIRLRRRGIRLSERVVGAQSLYPVLMSLTVSGSIVLHRSVWHFVPSTWVEYYFHPTLNPLSPGLPVILAIFLATVWLLLILVIAMVDDLTRKTAGFPQFLGTLLFLIAQYIVVFAVFAVLCPYVVALILLPVYWGFVLWRYITFLRRHATYVCGNCGHQIEHLGRCPHCGTLNK